MADFLDSLGSHLSNRIDQRFGDLQDQYGAVGNYLNPNKPEEDTSANVQPVTQTIKFDPVTGQQKMTISGRPEDLSAANPNTPTVTMPGAPVAPQAPAAQAPAQEQSNYHPEAIAQALQQAGLNYAPPKPIATLAQAGMSDVNPPAVTTPPAATTAAAPVQPQPEVRPPVVQAPPAAMVQAAAAPAAPVQPQPEVAAAPAAPVTPAPEAAPAQVPAAAVPAARPVGAEYVPPATTAAPTYVPLKPIVDAFNSADPAVRKEGLLAAASNKELPEAERAIAGSLLRDQLNEDAKQRDAERKLSTATPNDLARYMKERGDEGSYIKAILYNRLGLTDLAKEEQMKLGGGRLMAAETDASGNNYTVVRNAQGGIVRAFDGTGQEVDQKKIAQLSAESVKMKGATTAATLGKDANGQVWSHTIIPGTSRMVWQNQTTGEISSRAPRGYHSMGQKELDTQAQEKALAVASQIEGTMRRENANAVSRGMPAPHTEESIASARSSALSSGGVYNAPGGGAGGGLASSGGNSAAAGNNPTGYGAVKQPDGSYTWDTYPTPAAGVAATQVAVGRYLDGQGPMAGVKPTPENVVGTWVNGKPETGPKVQNGSYVASVRKNLADAGVRLNEDGTIPNTQAANDAVTRAMIVHESGPQAAQRFLPLVGGGTPAPTTAAPTAGAPVVTTPPVSTTGAMAPGATPGAAPTTAAASANATLAQKIANYEAPPLTGAGDKGRNAFIMAEVNRLNPGYDGQKYKENSAIIKDFTPGGTAGKSVVAMGTAANHIGDLRPLVDAINNGNYQAANQFFNNIKQWTGNPDVTNIAAVGPAVAAEIAKTFTSTGGGIAEREELAKAFSRANSPAQLKGAIDQYEKLMVGKLAELEKQYSRTGRKDFWQNVVSDPYLKESHDRHVAEKAARSGKPLTGSTTSGVKWKVTTE